MSAQLQTIINSAFGALIGVLVAFIIIFFTINMYIDAKMVKFNDTIARIETIVTTSSEKIETITTAVEAGVGSIDEKVTETQIYQRIFGNNE